MLTFGPQGPDHGTMIRVSAGVFLDEWRILVSRRSAREFVPFKWQFPGGKANENESNEDALCRELKEELGIDVLEYHYIGSASHKYSSSETVTVTFYLIDEYAGEIGPMEGQVLRWVNLCEPPRIDIIAANRAIF